jgi:hypothetical protein
MPFGLFSTDPSFRSQANTREPAFSASASGIISRSGMRTAYWFPVRATVGKIVGPRTVGKPEGFAGSVLGRRYAWGEKDGRHLGQRVK